VNFIGYRTLFTYNTLGLVDLGGFVEFTEAVVWREGNYVHIRLEMFRWLK